ncbi:MAG: serine/threonine protein kinase, partial [Roseiflexaceae bacterium]|nr:serine/threonine protein kinase [Roseiflexaceae bacterium]
MSQIPLQLGQYAVTSAIQRGTTAIIYKGYQPSLGRTVAIKVLQRTDSAVADQFKRNALAIAQLEHHNILPIYDYGEQDGQLYVVMQYIEHESTIQNLLGEPAKPQAALHLIAGVLDALAYAHSRGVLHRDIKPSNVLLPLPDWPVLSDFGLIDTAGDQQQLTLPPIPLNSALYMAPEHAEGLPVDERTDLYSLGAVLYHLVVGRPPFGAKTALALLRDHAYTPLPLPRSLHPTLHPAIERLLLRAMAKHPDERFQQASAMAEEVRRVARHVAQSRQHEQLGPLYEAGLQAFSAGEWAQALGQ